MGKEEELKKLSKKNSGRFLELDVEFKELVNEIKTINREPRASAILVEAYVGYVCDKLLEYRFETNALEDLPLRTKREILVKLGIITKGMSHDIDPCGQKYCTTVMQICKSPPFFEIWVS